MNKQELNEYKKNLIKFYDALEKKEMKTYKCPKCQQVREIWEFGGKKICIHCQLEQIINCIDFVNDMLRDNLKELKNIINIIRLP